MNTQQRLKKIFVSSAVLCSLMLLQGCSGEQDTAPKAPADAPAKSAPAPTGGTSAESAMDVKALYTACATCHAAGVANAPIVGNAAQWAPRIATGIDALTTNAIKGKGAMPPKGGRADYSDEKIKAIVEYMVNASK